MRIVTRLFKLSLALTLFGALPFLASAQDPKPQIKAELESLQRSLQEKPIVSPDFPEMNSNVSNSLKAASQALDSGDLYLALERLLQAEDLFHGARAIVDKADAVKSSFPGFEAELQKASQNLNSLNDEAHKRDWNSAL